MWVHQWWKHSQKRASPLAEMLVLFDGIWSALQKIEMVGEGLLDVIQKVDNQPVTCFYLLKIYVAHQLDFGGNDNVQPFNYYQEIYGWWGDDGWYSAGTTSWLLPQVIWPQGFRLQIESKWCHRQHRQNRLRHLEAAHRKKTSWRLVEKIDLQNVEVEKKTKKNHNVHVISYFQILCEKSFLSLSYHFWQKLRPFSFLRVQTARWPRRHFWRLGAPRLGEKQVTPRRQGKACEDEENSDLLGKAIFILNRIGWDAYIL